jgi:starvation-inducible DNA-binding protein
MPHSAAASTRTVDRKPATGHVATTEALQGALFSTFLLYRDTHLAHFNVRGPAFPQLHALLEAQYNEIWLAVDEVAERIRALGHLVTHGALGVPDSELPQDAGEMLVFLAQRHTDAVAQWQELFGIAEAAADHATGDLCNSRIRAHQKHAWMLGATAEPV